MKKQPENSFFFFLKNKKPVKKFSRAPSFLFLKT